MNQKTNNPPSIRPIISLGNTAFESIRTGGNFYIDKSDFIRQWWENQDFATLITRLQITLKRNASSATAEWLFHF